MVVEHMAALTQGLQISRPIIGGVVVKVRSRQRHSGRAKRDGVPRKTQSPAASIAPGALVFIPPSTIA
jgi:hypothetical protein